MYCKVCGNPIKESDTVCKVCGTVQAVSEERVDEKRSFADKSIEIKMNEEPMIESPLAEETAVVGAEDENQPRVTEKTPPVFEVSKEMPLDRDSAFGSEATGPNATETKPAKETKKENLDFSWNVYSFPKPRKTDELAFDWGEPDPVPAASKPVDDSLPSWKEIIAEETPAIAEVPIKIEQEIVEAAPTEDVVDQTTATATTEEEPFAFPLNKPLTSPEKTTDVFPSSDDAFSSEATIEIDLRAEKTLFEAAEEAKRLFEFEQKNEEFQKLLDREYDRIKAHDESAPMIDFPTRKFDDIPALCTEAAPAMPEPEPRVVSEPPVAVTVEPNRAELTATEEVLAIEEAPVVEEAPIAEASAVEAAPATAVEEAPAAVQAPVEEAPAPKQPIAEEVAAVAETEAPQVATTKVDPPLWFDETEEKESPKAKGPKESVPKKKHTLRTLILILIILVLVAEIAALAIRYFSPESEAAQRVSAFQSSAGALVSKAGDSVGDFFAKLGKDDEKEEETTTEEAQTPDAESTEATEGAETTDDSNQDAESNTDEKPVVDTTPAKDKNVLIKAASASNQNIKKVEASTELTFQKGRDYGKADINQSVALTENVWMTDDDGYPLLYDQEIVKTLMAFDSQWIDYVNGGSDAVIDLTKKGSTAYKNATTYSKVGKIKETFDLLQIGEIRKGTEGFYVFTYEELTQTVKGVSTEYNYHWIYYLEPVNGEMKIVSYTKY